MPSPTRTTLVVLLMFHAFPHRAKAAEPIALTLDRALELARTRAPETAAASLRVEEARGRLEGASVLLQENPALAAAVGPRVTGPSGLAVEAELSQTFELGGKRSARILGARAGVDRALAETTDVSRRTLRDAGVAFYRALYAERRVKLATRTEELAGDTLRIAEKRHQAGDVPVLHVNVARGALARARSERNAMEAERATALGELRVLLGIEADTPIVLQGELSERSRFERAATAQASREERADVRALEAELREAGADLRLGGALAWPDVGLSVSYQQEEADSAAVLGGLSFTLPLFERGQGLRAEARARARRIQLELDAARRRARIEVETDLAAYRKRVESLVQLEGAAQLQEQNETLARRSYEMGELGLAELLLVRREVIETQVEFLDRQLDVATAGIELEAATGALQ